jgi:hypothetical protein
MEMTATPTARRETMYGRGHLRTGTGKQHKHHGPPMFPTTAAERIAAWEAKQAAAKAAKEASKAS